MGMSVPDTETLNTLSVIHLSTVVGGVYNPDTDSLYSVIQQLTAVWGCLFQNSGGNIAVNSCRGYLF